jgi:pimeloyl-ACP methyl ester carboxylesterase
VRPTDTFDVAVAGGSLHVGRWTGRDGTLTVLAAHGITANHVSFSVLADALAGDVTLVAPDLRGRGRSNAIAGPFGITAHADDMVRVLDQLGLESAVLLGHSMGAWVAACTAVRHPDRVPAVVLVDGGLALPGTTDLPVDDVLDAVLGPAIARLSMTFESREAYHDFWRQHPAIGGDHWTDEVTDYVDYDLVGEPPELRSSVSIDAVRGDATEQLTVPEVRDVVDALGCPTYLLFAPRGILDGDPLYPPTALDALRPGWRNVVSEEVVPDVNHYTIVLGPGAPAVAETVRRAVAS